MTQSTPKVVQDCHSCLLWLIPIIDKFPRQRRFTLGDKIETKLLLILELLIEATYSQRNKKTLSDANKSIAVVKHLWRLSFELKVIASKQYAYGSKLLVDLGKQVGGWQKSAR